MLELIFRANPESVEPVYRQLVRFLGELIEARRLVAGERLPPSRDLAEQLGLSRNTVSHAYQTLVDRGVLSAHVGRGTFVAERSRGCSVASDVAPGGRTLAWEGLLSLRAREAGVDAPRARPRSRDLRFDFGGGRIDPLCLPGGELRRAWGRASEKIESLANPPSVRGWPPLREEIALALVARGIVCEPEHVLVVAGAQQALDLLGRVLLDPGDLVAIEQPGYFGAATAFRGAGARLVGVPVDQDGIRTDALARVLRSARVKLVYVTPSAQSPTGAILSEERRATLLELSDVGQVPVIEDDYDSELRFGSRPLPALKTRDEAGRVVYVGTFSKALFPGLRLGYVVAPQPLLPHLARARTATSASGSDAVAQAAVAELLRSGALERHVRKLRRVHAARRVAMLDALEREMPEDVHFARTQGGQSVWVTLPGDCDPELFAAGAASRGIAYDPGAAFHFDGRGSDSLGLSFLNQDETSIAEGVAELAAVVRASRVVRVAPRP